MHLPRRHFLQTLGAGTLALTPAWRLLRVMTTWQNQELIPLRRNVGISSSRRGGTMAWLINPEGIAVVDTQFPEQAEAFIQALRSQSEQPIELLFNTHHHGDHSSGNIAYRGLAKKVVAHRNSKANQERVAKEREREHGQWYPDTVFDTEWSARLGDETIRLRYFGPAHTNGDAIIHFEQANVVHLGDLLFNRRFPYIDMGSGASISGWIEVLERALNTFDRETRYIFGHGAADYPVTGSGEDLRAMQNYFERLLAHVKKGIQSGLGPEEMLEGLETIPGAGEWQGKGIQRSIEAAYQELVR